MSHRILKVCIDARIPDGVAGGVQQTLIGLASGLSQLGGDAEEYAFLSFADSCEWLRPHLDGSCHLLPARRPPSSRGWRAAVRSAMPLLDRAAYQIAARLPLRVPISDATIESAEVDVMHFALQQGFLTKVPSIYVPHDLQHRHFPEFFSAFELKWRNTLYPALARQATKVVALSQWGKRDLVEQLQLDEGKIAVIGWAPVLDAYATPTDAELRAVRERLRLPDAFALFPAQVFRHKNHLRLIEAIALLRDREGVRVPLVCCGRKGEFAPVVERDIRRRRLEDLVHLVGFVTPGEVRALYELSRLLVFPSLFEGFGMPVVEAFRAEVPAACSNVTSLPELAGDAALTFDPARVEEIAAAVRRLWTDAALRHELVRRGRERVAKRSWAEVAKAYRALYRLVGGRQLGHEDQEALRAAG